MIETKFTLYRLRIESFMAGVPASDIVFEITERSDIENYQILQQIMKHYADQGYEIALDDV